MRNTGHDADATGQSQTDRKVKTLFRGMFASADRKLVRGLERQGRPERARKIRDLRRPGSSGKEG